jgi:hypothetical protein
MLVLDTSALLKRYVEEDGTARVLHLMATDRDWCASALALAEAQVALRHLQLDEDARRVSSRGPALVSGGARIDSFITLYRSELANGGLDGHARGSGGSARSVSVLSGDPLRRATGGGRQGSILEVVRRGRCRLGFAVRVLSAIVCAYTWAIRWVIRCQL